jgi:hypothetical protein
LAQRLRQLSYRVELAEELKVLFGEGFSFGLEEVTTLIQGREFLVDGGFALLNLGHPLTDSYGFGNGGH